MKKLLIALLFILCLSSCKTNNNKTNDKIEKDFEDGKTFITSLDDTELSKPKLYINSFDDFIYTLDYLSYYQIGEKIYFYISDDYSNEFYNPYQEYLNAYKASLIAETYPCVFNDDYYSSNKAISIKFSISKDIATKAPTNIYDGEIIKDYDFKLKGNDNYIPELLNNNKGSISCETSEQLYYLVSNNYLPIPKENSIAESIYIEAINVLKKYINNNMTDYEKIRAIYDYLSYEIKYDYETAYSESTYLSDRQAYYLEGVFLNKCAVCDGKAKAVSLLLNLMNIDCKRCAGKNNDSDHAWNIVNLDNKWYILCSTWAQSKKEIDGYKFILPSHNMLLTSSETAYKGSWGYKSDKYIDLYELLEKEEYDVYDHKINNIDEAKELIDSIKQMDLKESVKLEMLYLGNDINFENELNDYLDNNIYLINSKSVKNKLYEVIFIYEGN